MNRLRLRFRVRLIDMMEKFAYNTTVYEKEGRKTQHTDC
jgi:hypothetical protein